MLKKIVSHASIELEITPLDPLLIKSGQATVSGVDMAFVQTYRNGKAQPFIPGSSLKGVIRSYAEKICRSLRDAPVPVCLPYLDPGKARGGEAMQASCGLVFEKYKKDNKKHDIGTDNIYRLSCPACRLFGSHDYIGRLATTDGYLTDSHILEVRNGVAIDRFTGGTVQGALYDLEVLVKGIFKTSIDIRNFERWQLGLIGLVLRDMEDGLIRIGFGKSRGFGRIKAKIIKFRVSYYKPGITQLTGIYSMCSEAERASYGLHCENPTETTALPEAEKNSGLRIDYDITESWKEKLNPALTDLQEFITKVTWPSALEDFVRSASGERRQ